MSIFIAVSRFGTTRRLYCGRKLAVHAGEDRLGSFTIENPQRIFFSLYSSNGRFSCTLEDDRFSFGICPSTTRSCWLTENESVIGPDYRFEFFITSPLSEILARCGATADTIAGSLSAHAPLPRLAVAIAGTMKTYSIPEGVEISVGSDPSDSIMLEGHGISASHLSIRNNGSEVEIFSGNGKISVNGSSSNEKYIVSSSAEITINPAGIPLQLSF
ncbi:MAG: hypothetical protein J5J00_04225 [Deltaproteobacteria bacterium]|nr:hypothetical protein [Deltaproteobacteria bacterium]